MDIKFFVGMEFFLIYLKFALRTHPLVMRGMMMMSMKNTNNLPERRFFL